jgi:hypothetical protein
MPNRKSVFSSQKHGKIEQKKTPITGAFRIAKKKYSQGNEKP